MTSSVELAKSSEITALSGRPIRDLGLQITGTRLEPIVAEFYRELERVGLTRVRPRFYLSTEWGVPFPSLSVAVPFYLARPELVDLHAERHGHIEGDSAPDILRYLRHETGHVINYAYRLYDCEDWVKQFGSMTQPYIEEYRPSPFSHGFVRHLPGWYAQKHPDEDWAETFAVWMTPGLDWRREYAEWPRALAKLEYCEREMLRVRQTEPLMTDLDPDEEVNTIAYSLDHYYGAQGAPDGELPRGLNGALRAIFLDEDEAPRGGPTIPASRLIRRFERRIMRDVFLWTGHFPERTRVLLRGLATAADQLSQVYREERETAVLVGLTTLVTALAMNHVNHGTYEPKK